MESLLKAQAAQMTVQKQQIERVGNSVINVQNSVIEGREQQAALYVRSDRQMKSLATSVVDSAAMVRVGSDKCSDLLSGLDNRFDEEMMLATTFKKVTMDQMSEEMERRKNLAMYLAGSTETWQKLPGLQADLQAGHPDALRRRQQEEDDDTEHRLGEPVDKKRLQKAESKEVGELNKKQCAARISQLEHMLVVIRQRAQVAEQEEAHGPHRVDLLVEPELPLLAAPRVEEPDDVSDVEEGSSME